MKKTQCLFAVLLCKKRALKMQWYTLQDLTICDAEHEAITLNVVNLSAKLTDTSFSHFCFDYFLLAPNVRLTLHRAFSLGRQLKIEEEK
jgi:hypothetical protein